MLAKVRESTFETNSSSTHALSLRLQTLERAVGKDNKHLEKIKELFASEKPSLYFWKEPDGYFDYITIGVAGVNLKKNEFRDIVEQLITFDKVWDGINIGGILWKIQQLRQSVKDKELLELFNSPITALVRYENYQDIWVPVNKDGKVLPVFLIEALVWGDKDGRISEMQEEFDETKGKEIARVQVISDLSWDEFAKVDYPESLTCVTFEEDDCDYDCEDMEYDGEDYSEDDCEVFQTDGGEEVFILRHWLEVGSTLEDDLEKIAYSMKGET